jgi:hypothetical protein
MAAMPPHTFSPQPNRATSQQRGISASSQRENEPWRSKVQAVIGMCVTPVDIQVPDIGGGVMRETWSRQVPACNATPTRDDASRVRRMGAKRQQSASRSILRGEEQIQCLRAGGDGITPITATLLWHIQGVVFIHRISRCHCDLLSF